MTHILAVARRRAHDGARAACLLVALLGAVTAAAEPKTYRLDPDHVGIGFLVDHIGYAKVLGMFRKAGGSFIFDEATGALGDIRIEIDAASVYSNHQKRDEHLRSADFLNANEFPTLVFTAPPTTPASGRNYSIQGELELLGVRRPVTLEATWNKSGAYPFGGNPWAMGVSARGSFRRSEFGMNYAVDNGWVGDEVELIIEFEARPQ